MSTPVGGEGHNVNIAVNGSSQVEAVSAEEQEWLITMMGSLSVSDQEKVVKAFDASVPILSQIVGEGQLRDAYSETVSAILDGWSKSLEAQKEAVEAAEKKKEIVDAALRKGEKQAQIQHDLAMSPQGVAEKNGVQKIEGVEKAGAIDQTAAMATGMAAVNSTTGSSPMSAQPNYAHSEAHMMLVNQLTPVVAAAVTLHAEWEKATTVAASKEASRVENSRPQGDMGNVNSQALSSVVMLSMLVSGIVAFAVPVAANGVQLESQIIQGAWNALSPGIVDSATVLAGNISAMWGVGLIYQVSAENIDKYMTPKKEASKEHNLNFAIAYAHKVVGSLKGLAAVITHAMADALDLKGKDFTLLLAKGKVVVLATALALLVKTELGRMNEIDFKGFLHNPNVTLGDTGSEKGRAIFDAKKSLIETLRSVLAELPSKERKEIEENLASYFSTDRSVEELLDQQNIFYEVISLPSSEKKDARSERNPLEREAFMVQGG